MGRGDRHRKFLQQVAEGEVPDLLPFADDFFARALELAEAEGPFETREAKLLLLAAASRLLGRARLYLSAREKARHAAKRASSAPADPEVET